MKNLLNYRNGTLALDLMKEGKGRLFSTQLASLLFIYIILK